MHPQLPGVFMMAIMGIFNTPKTTTPPPTPDPLNVLLGNASEAMVNGTELPYLSNSTLGLFTTSELVPLIRGSLLDSLLDNAVEDDNYTAPFHLTASYVPLWNASQVGQALSSKRLDRRLVGPLKVGTPGAEYRMLFDNGYWSENVLFGPPISFYGLRWYEYLKRSFTYEGTLKTKKIENVTGIYTQTDDKREDINDIFWVSKVHSFRQNFAVIESEKENEEIAALFHVLPADGILSLSSAPKLTGSYPSFLNASLARMRDQVVTFHVMPASNFTDREQNVVLSFGDLDHVHCNKDNWTVVPQLNRDKWSFHLHALGFSYSPLLANEGVMPALQQMATNKRNKLEVDFGNSTANTVESSQDNSNNTLTRTGVDGRTKNLLTIKKYPGGVVAGHDVWRQTPGLHTVNQTAAVVIAQGLSYAPAEHVQFMAEVLGAQKNISSLGEELYSMPCAPSTQNKNLLLTIYLDEGKTIVLRRQDLLMIDPVDPTNCIFIFVENQEVNDAYEWALGGSFFQNHCAMLDYAHHKFGFASVMPPTTA